MLHTNCSMKCIQTPQLLSLFCHTVELVCSHNQSCFNLTSKLVCLQTKLVSISHQACFSHPTKFVYSQTKLVLNLSQWSSQHKYLAYQVFNDLSITAQHYDCPRNQQAMQHKGSKCTQHTHTLFALILTTHNQCNSHIKIEVRTNTSQLREPTPNPINTLIGKETLYNFL